MDDYYSITIANYELIWVIKFVSRISTHPCKKFYKQIYSIFLNEKISFNVIETKKKSLKTNRLYNLCYLDTLPSHVSHVQYVSDTDTALIRCGYVSVERKGENDE